MGESAVPLTFDWDYATSMDYTFTATKITVDGGIGSLTLRAYLTSTGAQPIYLSNLQRTCENSRYGTSIKGG